MVHSLRFQAVAVTWMVWDQRPLTMSWCEHEAPRAGFEQVEDTEVLRLLEQHQLTRR
jgi:hypothetical protein